ncbi:MAG: cytochrome c oxidase assembly protein [Acidimicrobiales bacterium]|nr:cytochrome c oxidase assembly protein [Acidimicrobiales bacterium]
MGGTVPYIFHGEVWALIVGALALGWYAAKVIQPRAVSLGYPAITRRQKVLYLTAVATMWVMSDYPIHDVAENYLYFVHMIQHMFLSMIIPALFILATPRWLLELVIPPDSTVWRGLRRVSRPLFALVVYNALTIILHFPITVEISARSGALHFLLHLMVFSAGLVMWMPVIGPITEWHMPPLGKCLYLFGMSIVPTVPSGFLVFAEGIVYDHYQDAPFRMWGLSTFTDQTAAGLVMKLGGGFLIWAIIVVVFARWVTAETRKDEVARRARRDAAAQPLTFESVAEQFAKAPAPTEP